MSDGASVYLCTSNDEVIDLVSRGGVAVGDLLRYQLWYRDPGGPCGSSFNFTNGYEVTWLP